MERWQQIEEIFQEALQHDPAERDAFVREAAATTPSYLIRHFHEIARSLLHRGEGDLTDTENTPHGLREV